MSRGDRISCRAFMFMAWFFFAPSAVIFALGGHVLKAMLCLLVVIADVVIASKIRRDAEIESKRAEGPDLTK